MGKGTRESGALGLISPRGVRQYFIEKGVNNKAQEGKTPKPPHYTKQANRLTEVNSTIWCLNAL